MSGATLAAIIVRRRGLIALAWILAAHCCCRRRGGSNRCCASLLVWTEANRRRWMNSWRVASSRRSRTPSFWWRREFLRHKHPLGGDVLRALVDSVQAIRGVTRVLSYLDGQRAALRRHAE